MIKYLFSWLRVRSEFTSALKWRQPNQTPTKIATRAFIRGMSKNLAKVDYAHSVVILLYEGEDHPLEIEGIIQVGYHKGRITVRSNGIDDTIRVSTTVEVAA